MKLHCWWLMFLLVVSRTTAIHFLGGLLNPIYEPIKLQCIQNIAAETASNTRIYTLCMLLMIMLHMVYLEDWYFMPCLFAQIRKKATCSQVICQF